MLPEPIPELKGKALEKFLEYDRRPLSKDEVELLRKADETFRKHPPKL
jgi:hypothetical protein